MGNRIPENYGSNRRWTVFLAVVAVGFFAVYLEVCSYE
jgi:hypothetical protein